MVCYHYNVIFKQRVSVCTVKQRRVQYRLPQRAHVYLQQYMACKKYRSVDCPYT
jgi:hypothetical protein